MKTDSQLQNAHSIAVSFLVYILLGGCSAVQSDNPGKTAGAPTNKLNLNLDDSLPLFCRDSMHIFQPFQRTNLGRLRESFIRQFGWNSKFIPSSQSLGVLLFSVEGNSSAKESIKFDIEPHDNGVALLHMHVRLDGITEDLSGSEMCWKVFDIVNIK